MNLVLIQLIVGIILVVIAGLQWKRKQGSFITTFCSIGYVLITIYQLLGGK